MAFTWKPEPAHICRVPGGLCDALQVYAIKEEFEQIVAKNSSAMRRCTDQGKTSDTMRGDMRL
ncbi:MAG: hypothetical protein C4B59_14315 [Candidatus Methanogaster sp.]|uniref:Uncharacterized protein n=1 Tax=Candidatus Methanogaster sp. TaxID=3386292 RepID=A0AC61KZ46_9EURY|nr:MAG: hypothetical protein C4B59_14315 [ANME-2 cluster archaeon]